MIVEHERVVGIVEFWGDSRNELRCTFIGARASGASMGYKSRGAKVRVEFIKGGTEILLSANREGLHYLAEICSGLADEEYDRKKPPHSHIEPALNSAELESVPMEILLKPDL